MADAFIYDAVRTPRGRGKADGSLHEVPAVDLSVATLNALRERNDLDPMLVEDVVLGCVDPVGEAGGDIARAAVLKARFGKEVPGIQINRFCASGLDAVNLAAAQAFRRISSRRNTASAATTSMPMRWNRRGARGGPGMRGGSRSP